MQIKTIKCVIFDVDGVLTDGQVYLNQDGKESKVYRLTEIDALSEIKKLGIKIAAITGENSLIVSRFQNLVDWDSFTSGCKDKLQKTVELTKKFKMNKNDICFIGDGKYDIPVIEYAGLGVCPSNAIQEAKDIADIVLNGAGGESCVYELYHILRDINR